jgi:hypothetical protein
MPETTLIPLLEIVLVFERTRKLPFRQVKVLVNRFLAGELLRKVDGRGAGKLRFEGDGQVIAGFQVAGAPDNFSNCIVVSFLGEQEKMAMHRSSYRGESWMLNLGDLLFESIRTEIVVAGFFGTGERINDVMARTLILGQLEGAVWLNARQVNWLEQLVKDSQIIPIYHVEALKSDKGMRLQWPGWWGNSDAPINIDTVQYPWMVEIWSHHPLQDVFFEAFTVVGFGELLPYSRGFKQLCELGGTNVGLALSLQPHGRIPEAVVSSIFKFFLYHRDHPEFVDTDRMLVASNMMQLPLDALLLPENLAALTFAFNQMVSFDCGPHRIEICFGGEVGELQRQLLFFPIDPILEPNYEYAYHPKAWMLSIVEACMIHFGWEVAVGGQVATSMIRTPGDVSAADPIEIPLKVLRSGPAVTIFAPDDWFQPFQGH